MVVFRPGDAGGGPALDALLLLGLARVPGSGASLRSIRCINSPAAGCWRCFVLFTTAATKLPSYWLPATPAAALLIGLALQRRDRWLNLAWGSSIVLVLLVAAAFWGAQLWVPLISDPEMPTLADDLLASGLVSRGAMWFSLAALMGAMLWGRDAAVRALSLQLPLLLFHLTTLIPIAGLADRLRQKPVRQAAAELLSHQSPHEPLAMVGRMKPSLHFHTGQVVLYEGRSSGALVNLADRLAQERRQGWRGRPLSEPDASPTVLLVIDQRTSQRPHWQDLQPQQLGRFGIYRVWRLDRSTLSNGVHKHCRRAVCVRTGSSRVQSVSDSAVAEAAAVTEATATPQLDFTVGGRASATGACPHPVDIGTAGMTGPTPLASWASDRASRL